MVGDSPLFPDYLRTSFIVNQYILNDMAIVFLDVRFAGEFLLIALLFYAVWRKRRKKA